MNTVQPTTVNSTDLTQEEIMKKNKEMRDQFLKKWREEKENPISKSILTGIGDDLKNLSVRNIFNLPYHIKGIVLFFTLFACGNYFLGQTFWSIISFIEAVVTIMIFIVIPSVRSLASQLDSPEEVAKIMGTSPIVVSQKAKKSNILKKYLQLIPLWKSIQPAQKQKQAA